MLKRDRSTIANRKFWDHVEQAAKIVRTWPAWMRGEPENKRPARKRQAAAKGPKR